MILIHFCNFCSYYSFSSYLPLNSYLILSPLLVPTPILSIFLPSLSLSYLLPSPSFLPYPYFPFHCPPIFSPLIFFSSLTHSPFLLLSSVLFLYLILSYLFLSWLKATTCGLTTLTKAWSQHLIRGTHILTFSCYNVHIDIHQHVCLRARGWILKKNINLIWRHSLPFERVQTLKYFFSKVVWKLWKRPPTSFFTGPWYHMKIFLEEILTNIKNTYLILFFLKICDVAISKSSIGTSFRYVRTYMHLHLSTYLWPIRCDAPPWI